MSNSTTLVYQIINLSKNMNVIPLDIHLCNLIHLNPDIYHLYIFYKDFHHFHILGSFQSFLNYLNKYKYLYFHNKFLRIQKHNLMFLMIKIFHSGIMCIKFQNLYNLSNQKKEYQNKPLPHHLHIVLLDNSQYIQFYLN